MATSQTIRVAAIQYAYEGGVSLERCKSKLNDYMTRALKEHADIILLPELFVLDMVAKGLEVKKEGQSLFAIAKHDAPKILEFLVSFANEHKVKIISGGIPWDVGRGVIRNRAHIIDPKTVHIQEKNYLTPDEKAYGFEAADELHCFQTELAKFAVTICFDSEYPGLSVSLGKERPEIIFIPSLTSAKGFYRVRWCAQARAVEHHAYVVVAGVIHDDVTPEYVGQGVVISPQSEEFSGVLAESPFNKEHVLVQELDLQRLRSSRLSTGFFPIRDS